MSDLFSFATLLDLTMLIFLQLVLGFDNLLYIAIESKRAPAGERQNVRRIGIAMAILLRLVLLFVILVALESFKTPVLTLPFAGVAEGSFTLGAIIFVIGGAFILYTAMKEIGHMLAIDHLGADVERKGQRSAVEAIAWIALMNLVFSFDSILSAVAITKSFAVLALAVVGSGLAMMLMADRVSTFLAKNRMYEVLGLFILLLVGVMLISEGAHQAHLRLFDQPVEALSKTTFYFAVAVMVLLDLAQGRYQKKLLAEKKAEIRRKL